MIRLKNIIWEMAAKQAVQQIGDRDKIIMTSKEEIKFKNVKQTPYEHDYHHKPKGLWYAIGTDWIDWVRMSMPDWEKDNLFKIETTNKVAVIKNARDCQKFEDEFGFDTKFWRYIDWTKVEKKYAGVELWDYNNRDYEWTSMWDVRSGCIWNKSGIKKITKIEL